MGIFSDLSSQTYRGSKAMLRCKGPQQSHHPVVFMKADALKAFLQVHLTKESSKLLVINTHKG